MRLLFVTNMYPNPERPGYGAFVWQQAEQLRQFDHIVDVVNILGFQSIMNYLKGAFEVLEKTSRITYDVVHAHYCLAEFPAWFRLQAPWVVTLQGSDALGSRFGRFCSRVIWHFVKPKITRPVSMLGLLIQPSPETSRCIVLHMPVVSAHPERHVVVRDCTPLASYR
jgi:hypothetical protein